MAKTKISEFSATPGNNTDIDGINIAEGCAPSGINDAIRELMAQLKDFQTGAAGDSFNGPVGTTTAAAGAFTTLSSTGNTTLGDASGDAITINGNTNFANVNPTLTAGTANGVAYLNGSKVLTTGSALTFDGTNLGIGVTPSAWSQGKAFEISAVGEGLWGNGLGDIWMLNGAYFNGGFKYSGTTKATAYRQGAGVADGSHSWHIAASGTAGNAISFTQAMTLDASGNLGVGSTSPSGRLTLQRASSGASTDINWKNEIGVDRARIRFGGTDEEMSFWTPSASLTEKMRIDSSGNLLVGATSAGTVGAFICPATYSYTTGSGANVFVDSSGRIMRSTSSLKYKTDVQDATHGLSDVLGLRSVTYKSKEESDGDKVFGGLIAEEVHAAGLSEFVQYADDGTPDAISYGPMVALCIKAIQEQQAIINQINAKVEAQAAEIAALKGQA